RPGAAEHGAQCDRIHRLRSDRTARGADQRHRGHARNAREAGVSTAMTLWSGRVGTELAPEAGDLLKAADAELLPYDIQGTLLHAERLHAAGLLDDAELADVRQTLARLESVDRAAGDVHSCLEAELGEVGRKIHAGRSRNDQVAAALRLYVVDARAHGEASLVGFVAAILEHAAADATTPMPGYTHLQRAQP